MTKYAGISIDVDPVHTHLQGYGIVKAQSDARPVYEIGLPRALALFKELGAKATFFLVAEDVRNHGPLLKQLVAAGHEIGCHSATHELPFDLSNPERRKREVLDAKNLLEDLSGAEVVGFRAPSWDLSEQLIEALIEHGFKYDASSYPSWAAYALRLSVRLKASSDAPDVALPSVKTFFAPANPHTIKRTNGTITEIPVSSCPLIRLPYYHTLSFLLPQFVFNAVESSTLFRKAAINYILHGVDFIELNDPNVPEELNRHPGMNLAINSKLEMVRTRLKALGASRELVSLQAIAESAVE